MSGTGKGKGKGKSAPSGGGSSGAAEGGGKGKSGKSKSVSRSSRAGLQFPVGRIHRHLKSKVFTAVFLERTKKLKGLYVRLSTTHALQLYRGRYDHFNFWLFSKIRFLNDPYFWKGLKK